MISKIRKLNQDFTYENKNLHFSLSKNSMESGALESNISHRFILESYVHSENKNLPKDDYFIILPTRDVLCYV